MKDQPLQALTDLCAFCETPIVPADGTWRHLLPLHDVDRDGCNAPMPEDEPLILGDCPPLDALPAYSPPPAGPHGGCASCGGGR